MTKRGAAEWEALAEVRSAELARALVRMGVMIHGQAARLLRIPWQTAKDLTTHRWDMFEVQYKVPKHVTSGRYVVPGNRIMSLLRLSDHALSEWSEREGLSRTRNRVPADMLGQTLNMVEMLIRLRHDGLLYDEWDMMLPQNGDEGLHAWLVKRDGDYTLGVFLLPMRIRNEDKRSFILSGIIRRVIQNSSVSQVLFLAPREHYRVALQNLSTIERVGRTFYLLPWESFLEHPRWFLEAIYDDENRQRKYLVEADVVDWDDRMRVPPQHAFGAFLRLPDGRYRLVDTYVNGSTDRVRNWREFIYGYQVPNTGQVAGADVYVFDETMREGLEAVLRMKSKKQFDVSMVEVHGWPEGMVKPKPAREASQDAFDEVDDSDIDWDAWLNEPW